MRKFLNLQKELIDHIDRLKNSLKERLNGRYYINEFIEATLIKYTSLEKKHLF